MVIKHLFINNNNLTLIKSLFIKSNLHNNFYYYANIIRYETELYFIIIINNYNLDRNAWALT